MMTDNTSEFLQSAAETDVQSLDNTPGSQLRRAREQAGLSCEELARRLCMNTSKLALLESDTYDRLPGALYVRGYIRNACKELGIDAEPVLQAFSGYTEAESESRALLEHVSRGPVMEGRSSGRGLRGLALLPLLVVGGVFWWLQDRDLAIPAFLTDSTVVEEPVSNEAEDVAVEPPASEPAAEPTLGFADIEPQAVELATAEESGVELTDNDGGELSAGRPLSEEQEFARPAVASAEGYRSAEKPVTAAVSSDQLQLRFTEDSWVEVKDASGAVLLASLKPAGSQVELEGQPPFKLMLGNAQGTQVRYRGELISSAPTGSRRTRRLTVGE